MGIKCSLFGHAFGEATVERDREEQGSEVVSTIREIQTCTRCGETRVVSENKEVTTLETPDDVEPTANEQQPEPEGREAGGAIVDAEDESADAEAAEPPSDEATDTVEAATGTADDGEEEPPVTDDAEILDEDDDTDRKEREPGQWPQEADEPEPGDEEFDQFGYTDEEEEAPEDDAELIDDEDPAGADESEPDREFVDESTESTTQATQTNEWPSEEEIDAAGEPESAGPGAVTVPDGSFHCESCGFSTPVESSSLREGDFCPECHRSTLVQVRDRE